MSSALERATRFLGAAVLIGASVIGGALLSPRVAHGQQSDEERARLHYNAALSYFDQARYEDAADEFRQAFVLSRRAHLLLNVATCFENLGRPADAAEALREYVQVDPQAEDRRTVEQRIEQLEARAASEAPPTAETPNTPATTARRGAEDEGSGLMLPGIITASVGGVFAIAAIGTGVAAHGIFTDLEEQCPADICPPSLMSDRDQGDTLALTSTVLTFGAAITGAVGLLLILLD